MIISVMEMKEGAEYKIEKLEKGPLQRFKNQNLLLKKFGEVGLQVYKVITGKRTSEELRNDLDMEPELFNQILSYMQEAGMVQLSPVSGEKEKPAVEEETPGEIAPEEELEEVPKKKKKAPSREEIPEEEPPEELEEEKAPQEAEEIVPEFEEVAPKKKRALPKEEEEAAPEEEKPSEEITEEIVPEFEEVAPKKKKKAPPKVEVPEEEPTEEFPEEEKAPEEAEEIVPEFEEEEPKKKKRPSEFEEEPEEEVPAEEMAPEEEKAEEEISSAPEEETFEKAEEGTPVEKIIRDKYGDIGIRVYTLIDGQRTAEEIMEETGLSESKLVEILDFLDEQGIIKLEYPKGKPEAVPAEKPKEAAEEFAPMVEEEDVDKVAVQEVSPDFVPVRLSISFIKSVQLRAKTMLRHGDIGDKVLAAVDGKSDLIDISMKLNTSLPKLGVVINFLRDEGAITLNQVARNDIRARYGEDGFTIYKKFGKEGLMLYELIGKEMSIKEMADRVTPDKAKVVDMFLFIYEVLGIEMPLNKEALMRQLGL